MTKRTEGAVVKLASDALVLSASLVLTAPLVNKKQLALAGRIIRQAKPIYVAHSKRKGGAKA